MQTYDELVAKYRSAKHTHVLRLVQDGENGFNLLFGKPLANNTSPILARIIYMVKKEPFSNSVDFQFIQENDEDANPFLEVWINRKNIDDFDNNARVYVITTFNDVDELEKFLGFFSRLFCIV